MAKVTFSLSFLGFIFLCFVVCSNYVEGKTWCVAQSKDSNSLLQEIIDRLCGQLDCKEIQPGGSCFDPNTLLDHASYVIDLNYHTNGECDINYATPAINDPSHGTCVYP